MEESIEPEVYRPPPEEDDRSFGVASSSCGRIGRTGSGVAAPVARGRIDRTSFGVTSSSCGRIDRTGSGVTAPAARGRIDRTISELPPPPVEESAEPEAVASSAA